MAQFDTRNADKFGRGLRRQVLDLVRRLDPKDGDAIELCARQLAEKFFEAGLKDFVRNYRKARPGATDEQVEAFLEASRPRPEVYRIVMDRMRGDIYKALKATGKVS